MGLSDGAGAQGAEHTHPANIKATTNQIPISIMQETTDSMILPTEYVPRALEEFFGPARTIALRIQKSAEMCIPRGAPASHLFVGPSGSGKTALARFTLEQFSVSKWNRHEVFGAARTPGTGCWNLSVKTSPKRR